MCKLIPLKYTFSLILLGILLVNYRNAFTQIKADKLRQDIRPENTINKPEEFKLEVGEDEKEETQKWDNAKGRDEFRLQQRLDDKGKFNIKALWAAKNHNNQISKQKDAGIWNWEWLGPGNIGGRLRAILIHPTNPNIIWIGAASGGIWKSTNSGTTWAELSDTLSNIAITSIVMDPNNTNILFAGTGEGFGNADGLPGAGIFKSTNGGTTWNQIASTSTWKHCNRIAISPSNSNILFAAVDDPSQFWGQLYKSTDGGSTWTSILIANSNAMEFVDVKICPLNANLILAGCYAGAYISSDGGNTWRFLATGNTGDLPTAAYGTGVTPIGRCEIAFAPSNASIIYISADRNSGEVWKSTDGGTTWSCANTGTNYFNGQGWYDNAIAVSPKDPNLVVVGGMDIWRSTNGGTNFTKISNWTYAYSQSSFSPHADHHVLVFASGDGGATYKILYNGSDGGLCKNTDINSALWNVGWINMNNGIGITQFYGGAASPDGSVIIGGTQDNGTLRYRPADGITNWGVWAGGDGGFCAINYNNPLIMYQEYIYLMMGKTTDGGLSGTGCTSGLTDAGSSSKALFIAPFVVDPNNPAILVAGGTSIWKTTNDAASWSAIKSAYTSRCSAIAIAKGNSNVIWVGYENGMVSKTTDGGSNWTNVNTGLPSRYITDIAIDPNNSNNVVLTLGGYVSTNIYYSSNAGNTWTLISGTAPNNIPAVQINTVTFNPYNSNWIYIGTDAGVYATEDLGAHWRITPRYSYTLNEGPVNVEVDELFWQGYYLIAATHGRGMFRCLPLNTIIVDINAAAGGNGTAEKPYNNINTALDNAGNGTTIIYRCGTYQLDAAHSNVDLTIHKKRLVLKSSCTGSYSSIIPNKPAK